MRSVKVFAAIAFVFMMGVMNVQAQRRDRGNNRGNGREMVARSNSAFQIRGRNDVHHSNSRRIAPPKMNHGRHIAASRPNRHPVHHVAHHHRVDHRGFLPGWGGRVRYLDGRWGYLRHNRWYWYSCYFEPDYYFAHPVSHFHTHISPVAAGAIGGAVLGAFIGALCR